MPLQVARSSYLVARLAPQDNSDILSNTHTHTQKANSDALMASFMIGRINWSQLATLDVTFDKTCNFKQNFSILKSTLLGQSVL